MHKYMELVKRRKEQPQNLQNEIIQNIWMPGDDEN